MKPLKWQRLGAENLFPPFESPLSIPILHTMKYSTEALNPLHKGKEFSLGSALLDNCLHQQAEQDMKRRLAACFILADENQRVTGYYTLSSTSV